MFCDEIFFGKCKNFEEISRKWSQLKHFYPKQKDFGLIGKQI